MRSGVAAVILDHDAVAHARNHIVRDAEPGVVGDADALAKNAEIVIDFVSGNLTDGILRSALSVRIDPDRNLADVLDDIIADDSIRVGRLGAIDAELSIYIGTVVDNARGQARIVAVNCEALESYAIGGQS